MLRVDKLYGVRYWLVASVPAAAGVAYAVIAPLICATNVAPRDVFIYQRIPTGTFVVSLAASKRRGIFIYLLMNNIPL